MVGLWGILTVADLDYTVHGIPSQRSKLLPFWRPLGSMYSTPVRLVDGHRATPRRGADDARTR